MQKGIKRTDEPSQRRRIAARKLSVARIDQAGMMGAVGEDSDLERSIVTNVLGHERALLALRGRKHVRVRRAYYQAMARIVNREDIVAPRAERDRERRRIHLVEQQPQASSSRSRASAASSLSASASLAAIQASISSG